MTILIILNIILTLSMPIACFFAFREGLKLGRKVRDNLPISEPKPQSIELSEEEQKFQTVLRNIEVYNGTDEGQIDV